MLVGIARLFVCFDEGYAGTELGSDWSLIPSTIFGCNKQHVRVQQTGTRAGRQQAAPARNIRSRKEESRGSLPAGAVAAATSCICSMAERPIDHIIIIAIAMNALVLNDPGGISEKGRGISQWNKQSPYK